MFYVENGSIFKQFIRGSDFRLIVAVGWNIQLKISTVLFNCLLFCLNLLILSPNLIWICQRLFGCVVKTWIQNAKQCGKILFSISFVLFNCVVLFSFETDLAGIWLSFILFWDTFVNNALCTLYFLLTVTLILKHVLCLKNIYFFHLECVQGLCDLIYFVAEAKSRWCPNFFIKLKLLFISETHRHTYEKP